ncbi:MAG: Short-chain dehydrogenase/reductase [Chloroflexi bacterium]|nr:Short-chain dehydrogenase/reductase [Chloroflexota bacterium]
MELKGRTAVVTGSAVRVGRQICLELARRGANVVVNYRSSAGAAATLVSEMVELGVGGLAVQADVSVGQDVRSLGEAARAEFGHVDVLVNNASVFPRTPLATLTEEQWDESIGVNLKGPFLCSLEFGRRMASAGEGVIVNLSDWAAQRPYIDYLPYLVAKGGIITMTKAFAKELAPHVRVNAIAPGPIFPPLDLDAEEIEESRAGTLVGHWGSPTDIARAVAFLIEGSDFITGVVLPVDGGRLVV